jgi:hypothetical protein
LRKGSVCFAIAMFAATLMLMSITTSSGADVEKRLSRVFFAGIRKVTGREALIMYAYGTDQDGKPMLAEKKLRYDRYFIADETEEETHESFSVARCTVIYEENRVWYKIGEAFMIAPHGKEYRYHVVLNVPFWFDTNRQDFVFLFKVSELAPYNDHPYTRRNRPDANCEESLRNKDFVDRIKFQALEGDEETCRKKLEELAYDGESVAF